MTKKKSKKLKPYTVNFFTLEASWEGVMAESTADAIAKCAKDPCLAYTLGSGDPERWEAEKE
jgi:hypothetical protein